MWMPELRLARLFAGPQPVLLTEDPGPAQVPSFDNAVAMEVVRQEFGRTWNEVFAELSPAPIAAASLGQV